jgi:uncharacterized membrane protein
MFKKYETTFIGMALSIVLLASLFAISGQSVQKALAQKNMTSNKTSMNVTIGPIPIKIGNTTIIVPGMPCHVFANGQGGCKLHAGGQ